MLNLPHFVFFLSLSSYKKLEKIMNQFIRKKYYGGMDEKRSEQADGLVHSGRVLSSQHPLMKPDSLEAIVYWPIMIGELYFRTVILLGDSSQ